MAVGVGTVAAVATEAEVAAAMVVKAVGATVAAVAVTKAVKARAAEMALGSVGGALEGAMVEA